MSYYNLEQTISLFQNNLPDKFLPFNLPQLADLCSRGEVTPVFSYRRYVIKGFINDYGQPIHIKKDVKSFNGYLTLTDLTDLLFQLAETVVTSNAYVYEEIGTESNGKFVSLEKGGYDHHDRYEEHDYHDSLSSGNTHYIGIHHLLFPSEQVQAYIASQCTHNLKNQPKMTDIIQNPADVTAEIADTESKLTQAKSDFKKASISSDKSLYTTPAINVMNEVITKFWINYSPDQPAPKQITITEWITDNFDDISPALALNIDKVCRHSDAKSGGKYKR